MQIISLPGNPDLNRSIEAHIKNQHGVEFVSIEAQAFPSGEEFVQIKDNVRGGDVFVIQSSSGSFGNTFAETSKQITESSASAFDGLSVLLSHEDEKVRKAALQSLFALTGIETADKMNEPALQLFLTRQIKRSVNDDFMSLLVTLDALRRAGAASINCVMPFIPYMRQDRKDKPRVPITARMIADMIEEVAGDRLRGIITSEMHVPQEQGFFRGPVDNLPMTYLYAADIKATLRADGIKPEDCVVISPDLGGEGRAEGVAGLIGCELSVFKKTRVEGRGVISTLLVPYGSSELMLKGKTAIIIDDIVDSANSLKSAALKLKHLGVNLEELAGDLKDKGAKTVVAYIAHPVFTEQAPAALATQGIDVLVSTNTLPIPPYMKAARDAGRLRIIDVGSYFAEAMIENSGGQNLQGRGSVSSLFSVERISQIYAQTPHRLGGSMHPVPL